MTRLEIIDDIIEGLSAYNVSDDSIFDREVIGFKVDLMRETFINDQYPLIDQAYYQLVCCLDIKCANEGCCIPGIGVVKSGDVTFYIDIPPLIVDVKDMNIKYVGGFTLSQEEEIKRFNLSGYQSLDARMYTKPKGYTQIGSDKIYLKNVDPAQKKLCMLALLSKPTDSCAYDETKDYPVPDAMKLIIAVKRDVLSTYGILPDVQQDSSGQPVENSMSGSKTSAAKGK